MNKKYIHEKLLQKIFEAAFHDFSIIELT